VALLRLPIMASVLARGRRVGGDVRVGREVALLRPGEAA
jgi:hypothetical protein